jgi:hypothetical protein
MRFITYYLYIAPLFSDKPLIIADERFLKLKYLFIYDSCPLV